MKRISKQFKTELLNGISGTLDAAERCDVEWRRNTVEVDPYPGGFSRFGPGDKITMVLEFTMKPPRRTKRKPKR